MPVTVAVATAYRLLSDAVCAVPSEPPGLTGPEAEEACAWLRDRARTLLTAAYRPEHLLHEMLLVIAVEHRHPEQGSRTSWEHTLAAQIVRTDSTPSGPYIGVSAHLESNPDGLLCALADVTAQLYRLHDGDGAPALLRSMRPA